jgi:hypothetical protein
LSPFDIGSGDTAEFILAGTFTNTSLLSTLDLMASGCTDAGTCKLDGGPDNKNSDMNKWAVSSPLTPVVTPEPGSLAMLGIGLFALVGFGRRRLVRS